jgi:hypothetical protein
MVFTQAIDRGWPFQRTPMFAGRVNPKPSLGKRAPAQERRKGSNLLFFVLPP